jgi:aminopeptidase
MRDPRGARLAEVVVRHSTRLEPGDNVLIEAFDVPDAIVIDLVEAAQAVGAHPIVALRSNAIMRRQLLGTTPGHLATMSAIERFQMERMQAYVGLRGSDNVSELSDVPPAHMALYQEQVAKPVHMDLRVPHTRWVVLRWPNGAMAQQAGMSTEAFESFYYDVCTMDYPRMGDAMEPLKQRMEQTDRVRITGPGTDLRFSIRGIPAIKCEGRRNLPDGECFTAPVRDSIEGTIAYNTPSLYLGTTYEHLRFTFEGGRIVTAEGTPQDKLDHLLDTDEGARHIGEFSLGFNPYILAPMKDTLFDEKIAGSLHFTPGQAYGIADNGNRSQIHWDLVLIQRPEYGGGEVWFDDERVRLDGRFVTSELAGLNPERLRS